MRLLLINEAGYARVKSFPYSGHQVTDPRPRILYLGKFRHPNTRNIIAQGINLNYLDEDQILKLRQALPQILAPRNLKSRYWKGRELLPDIFNNFWRGYDVDYVGAVSRDTLKFYPTPAELEKAEAEAAAEKELAAKGHDIQDPTIVPKAAAEPVAEPKAAPKVPGVTPEVPTGVSPAAEPIDKKIARKLQEPELEPGPEVEPEVKPEVQPEPKSDITLGVPEEPIEPEEKPVEPEAPEGMGPEAQPEAPLKGSEEADAALQPEVEKAPAKKQRSRARVGKKPKKAKPTSAQRRKQAKEIKKALEKQRLEAPPPPPPPPEEFKGVLGMFKPKEK